MKKLLIAIGILIGLVLVVSYVIKSQTDTSIVVTQEEDLNKELGTTEDDGGAADFVELLKSAEGL